MELQKLRSKSLQTNKRNEKQKIYNISGERRNNPSANFVDISAERANFFMKFYLLNNKIYTLH